MNSTAELPSSIGQVGGLAPTPLAGPQEILQILREELPAAGKVAGDQAAGADPVLDRTDADVEDLRDIAVAVHRLQLHLLDCQDGFQKRVLGGCGRFHSLFSCLSGRRHTYPVVHETCTAADN